MFQTHQQAQAHLIAGPSAVFKDKMKGTNEAHCILCGVLVRLGVRRTILCGQRVHFWQALDAAWCSTHLKHLLAFVQVSMLQKKLRSGRSSSLHCGAQASRSRRVAVVVVGVATSTPAVGTEAALSAPQSHLAQWLAVPERCVQCPPRWTGRRRL